VPRGFTLLEIVVVMALLSLVMLGLGASLRSFAGTETRIDARLERMQEQRAVVHFLQSVGGRLSAERRKEVPAGELPYWFVGQAQSLQWVGVMPARFGSGGRHAFRLALETGPKGQDLVLRYQPWVPDGPFPDWTAAEGRVLQAGVSGMGLRYLDDRAEAPVWLDTWTPVDHLPARVALTLEDGTSAWPELVLTLRPLPATTSDGSGFTSIGGRS
jgi:general secretion pathway protein J